MPRIVDAPSSTKNREGQRNTEMHQSKKGNQWCFGMKEYIGDGSRAKLIHSVSAIAANVRDCRLLLDLLQVNET